MSNLPIDQAARNSFTLNLDTNYSLVCPAGSGKTHSITERIVALAQRPDSVELLSRLMVVTFANASAQEMHSRAREALLAARVPWEVQRAFDFSFFGTIHSLANRLLRDHGHHIGLPPVFEVSKDIDGVWSRFVRRISEHSLAESNQVLRHYPIQNLLNLARFWDSKRVPESLEVAEMPEYDFSPVYNCEMPKRKTSAACVERYQAELRQFEQVLKGEGDVDFMMLPRTKTGGKEFIATVEATIKPVVEWINAKIAVLSYELACEFRDFRAKNGVLTFDDLVFFARQIMLHPRGKTEVRAKEFIFLLDEAQDTDPFQFDFLIEAARPINAAGLWRETMTETPGDGRFSMVGDLQQSIYSSRADLSVYRQAIAFIGDAPNGAHLNFEVTFRCDQNIVANAEKLYSSILDGNDGQVPYVPICSREDAAAGNVVRLEIPIPERDLDGADDCCVHEGEKIAEALVTMRQNGQISCWNDVALICPRTAWFDSLAHGLSKGGISSRKLSFGTKYQDSMAWSWITAIARSFTCPSDTYETVGLLRDFYGHSDVELFDYSNGYADRFILNGNREGDSPVAASMNRLSGLRKSCLRASLLDAVSLMIEEVRPRLGEDREELMILGRISSLAAKAEKSGVDLEGFAATLKKELTTPLETSGENPNDSVQIITDLKAKGLQWDVVIIPAFFRSIHTPNEKYPKLLGGLMDKATVATRSEDISAAEKERAERAQIQELGRRAYVTCTRPKHTLIFCDDEGLFEKSNNANKPNFAKVMRVDEDGDLRSVWDSIPAFDVSKIDMEARKADSVKAAPSVTTVNLDKARVSATPKMERVRPYRAATTYHSEEREFIQDDVTFIEGVGGRPSSITYGVWWHDTMKHTPWTDKEQAESHFQARLEICPDSERGAVELDKFLRSDLAAIIFSKAEHIKTELPFQYCSEEGRSIEGIIDFCMIDPMAGDWLIIDWKTNRNTEMGALLRQYSGQVQAYKDAVIHLVPNSKPVAGVYSTALGQHLTVA